jgi:hypothetical protein
MELKDLSPEDFAKIQALNQFSRHELSPDELLALQQYAPTPELTYIGEKGKAFVDAQKKAQGNNDMAKIMAIRLARQAEKNPEHINELYQSLRERIK